MTDSTTRSVCPACGKKNVPGTLFCVDCGTYLPMGGPLRTEPLPEHDTPAQLHPRDDEGLPAGEAHELHIEVEITQTKRRIMLTTRREILLGRTDAARGIFPQLDLTADEGSEQSVSRRHARIFAQDGACYIEDLDSTNGTFLNGTRLKPHQPYAIRDGDALTVGKLDLLVQMRPQD